MMRFAALPFAVFAVLLTVPATVHARQVPSAAAPSLTALRVDDSAIEIDGRLEEAPWREATFADGFTQRDPEDGSAATERTEVRVAAVRRRDLRRCPCLRLRSGCDHGTTRAPGSDSPSPTHIYDLLRLFSRSPDSFPVRGGPEWLHHGDRLLHERSFAVVTSRGIPCGRWRHPSTSWGGSLNSAFPLTQLRFATDQATWGFQVRRYIQRKKRTSVLGAMVQSIQRVRVAFR